MDDDNDVCSYYTYSRRFKQELLPFHTCKIEKKEQATVVHTFWDNYLCVYVCCVCV